MYSFSLAKGCLGMQSTLQYMPSNSSIVAKKHGTGFLSLASLNTTINGMIAVGRLKTITPEPLRRLLAMLSCPNAKRQRKLILL